MGHDNYDKLVFVQEDDLNGIEKDQIFGTYSTKLKYIEETNERA